MKDEEDDHQERRTIRSGSVTLMVSGIENGLRSKRPSIHIQPPVSEGLSRAGSPIAGDMVQMMDLSTLAGPLARMAEEPIASKISMPGISNIFGRGNKARRIVWTLVVVAAISIATVQVSGSY